VISDPGIRNLDQLQEEENGHHVPRGITAALVVLGGACVVFASLALGGRTSQTHSVKVDPLGDLVSRGLANPVASSSSGARSLELLPKDVTFPLMLSDEGPPTTALAAVRTTDTSVAPLPAVPSRPPPPTDRLPVVPLPAQAVLEASPIVTRPRDALTQAANDAAQISTPPVSGDVAVPGHEGGYQLQVSSFRTEPEADGFAAQLRARGHKAYVAEAHVLGRGTWYRVRVGPFQTQHAAAQYRASFEEREHVVPFIVPPETTAKAH
jgi:cell division septation protein DedD